MQALTENRSHAITRDWPIIFTAGAGFFLSAMDTGIMNVALPALSQIFHSNVRVMAWTATLYLLLLSATIVVFGRISDRVGRLKVYSMGLIIFAIASLLCGMSFSATQLILFRGLQGIGAAMLQATSAAIITTCIPQERRGAALGTLGMILGLGNILGPGAGGLLLSFAGWPWIFWINLPICAVGLWGSFKLAKATKESCARVPLNLTGNLFLGVAVFGFLYGLSADTVDGFARTLPFCFFAAALTCFVVWEARAAHPIVPLSLFRKVRFVVPVWSGLVLGFATAIAFIAPAYFLEEIAALEPWQVGLVNLAAPAGLVLLSGRSGRLIGTCGTARLTSAGLALMLIALLTLSAMQLNWHTAVYGALLLLYGIGAGLFIPANLSAIMGSVSETLQGTIGSVQRMIHNIGLAVGTSAATAVLHFNSGTEAAGALPVYRSLWMMAAAAVLLALLGSVSLSRLRR